MTVRDPEREGPDASGLTEREKRMLAEKIWAGMSARAAKLKGARHAAKFEDALAAIAGDVDSCGHSHGSTLHDIGNVIEFASRVLRGEDPHEVLRTL